MRPRLGFSYPHIVVIALIGLVVMIYMPVAFPPAWLHDDLDATPLPADYGMDNPPVTIDLTDTEHFIELK